MDQQAYQLNKQNKAVTSSGTSYKGELEAIKISTEYAKEHVSGGTENIHIFVDCQSAIHAITQQNNENGTLHLTIYTKT